MTLVTRRETKRTAIHVEWTDQRSFVMRSVGLPPRDSGGLWRG